MKAVRFLVRVVLFMILLGFCLQGYFYVIKPKFDSDTWPTTTTVEGFYKLPRDSIDVLFIGSSHGVCAFMPQELEENFGLTAYNLSTAQQSPVVSYYWIQEALRYQSPQYIVMDCFTCFPYADVNPINQEESFSRSALDYMRWSSVKVNAIEDICSLDTEQSELSYYLPNIRYHSRWEELSGSDFNRNCNYDLRGSRALYYAGNIYFDGYELYDGMPEWPLMPLMEEYMVRIIDLCRENDIELILTLTPTIERNAEQSVGFENFARAHGLQFIDYNNNAELNRVGFNFALDCADTGHLNVRGARIITNDIGELITLQ